MTHSIQHLAIVGGGTAGWITAALMVRMLGQTLKITLVESDQISTVGVGEATIPPILALNQALGIDEADFIRKTNATIKLGIEFENWQHQGDAYMHAFGDIGQDFPFCGFEQFWLRGLETGDSSNFWDYSLNYQAAKRGRFAKLERIANTNMKGLVYAYHFDAGLYAAYLRNYSEQRGVRRIEGMVESVDLDSKSGDIESVTLASGEQLNADLFIDCSGFRALLIGQALGVDYQDWSHYLPCDSAVAMQSESTQAPVPYTRSVAHSAGWRWQIPLQNRVGNGLVFCSDYMGEEQAQNILLESVDGEPTSEPRVIKFQTGRRQQAWRKNCVAVGLSSGFLEPLESTSIHMIQSAVTRLIKLFPHKGVKPAEVCEYNRQTRDEIEHARDFLILHYRLNSRTEDFWRYCREMEIPESLQNKIDLFSQSGKIFNDADALFSNVAWHQVMIGQGIIPSDYHPLANSMAADQLPKFHQNIKAAINNAVEKLPSHADFLEPFSRGDEPFSPNKESLNVDK